MNPSKPSLVQLDLNNPVFQSQLLNLSKKEQGIILGTLKILMKMNWDQVYIDRGLKWEVILSCTGPDGGRLYSFRIGEGFRGVAYRHDDWLRILSLHPDHDSAYH